VTDKKFILIVLSKAEFDLGFDNLDLIFIIIILSITIIYKSILIDNIKRLIYCIKPRNVLPLRVNLSY
jgi:hypothetical protein